MLHLLHRIHDFLCRTIPFKIQKTPEPTPEPKYIICPNCGHDHFFEGPSGGVAMNIMCANCEQWFNYLGFGRNLSTLDSLHQVGRERRSI
ncbi:hypothetical protein [Methylocystis hirsuta]|uniref:Uncharacterized protein n=1 Tax=Methylocystis hirsuta TaxID=369798 RepID=A0A3M9XQL2_9HYPH|nr:hypothetical protein [Methylocystis hirsuta]RNJ49398.1 hypothetical protein D1O30_07070 [Methylocystis hirsuta]